MFVTLADTHLYACVFCIRFQNLFTSFSWRFSRFMSSFLSRAENIKGTERCHVASDILRPSEVYQYWYRVKQVPDRHDVLPEAESHRGTEAGWATSRAQAEWAITDRTLRSAPAPAPS